MSLLLPGCSHVERTRTKANAALEEHSRALTTAVVDVLQDQPAEGRNKQTALALDLVRKDQRIEGLPLRTIPVADLLSASDSNNPAAGGTRRERKAKREVAHRFAEIDRLLEKRNMASAKLIEIGAVAERERNVSRWRRAKVFSSTGVLVGSVIALFVFVPAALPLAGRLLAWLVGKVPALAGALGVVGVKAFDAVVKGIEKSRSSSGDQGEKRGSTALENTREIPARTTPTTAAPTMTSLIVELTSLDASLSREMDAAHKALVRSRKGWLAL